MATKVQVSLEQFAKAYVDVHNALFNDETDQTEATLQNVVDHLNSIGLDMTITNARQKVNALREWALKNGKTVPKLKRVESARQPRIDADAISAILSSAVIRQNLDQLD